LADRFTAIARVAAGAAASAMCHPAQWSAERAAAASPAALLSPSSRQTMRPMTGVIALAGRPARSA
jgi:hypothetical protein